MAEITKVTTPMIPRENMGSKNRPVTEQAFELNNPTKVNKPQQEQKTMDREAGGQILRENIGRSVLLPLLKDAGDLMYNIHKMVALLEMGISTSDIMRDPEVKQLLQEMFASPEELLDMIKQQDESFVLFKSDAFDVLRDVVNRFEYNGRVQEALINLLKTFEYHVNAKNSMKTIIFNCENLLDYMFSADRQQFSTYLDGLTEMILPELFAPPEEEQQQLQQQQAQQTQQTQSQQQQPVLDANGRPVLDESGKPVMMPQGQADQQPQELEQREAAQLLKNNLLPLLGEIVVKYHQQGRIRDTVMVVVHNIVRVDKGTPEALEDAVRDLVSELRKVANLPEKFEQNLMQAMKDSVEEARTSNNDVMDKLAKVISKTLFDPANSSPAALRQAETLLISLLQNQSSLMDVLHFMLPMQMEGDRLFAELYVDPDNEEGKAKPGEQCRKLFLSVDSENHGMLELCFLQTGEKVEFSMWCPEILMEAMTGLRRTVAELMQVHGYSMSGFKVQELKKQHTIADVFPKLLNRKVGIDVRV